MDVATTANGVVLSLPDMTGQAGGKFIAGIAVIVSAAVALFVYVRSEGRERRIEKSAAYLNLEVHSSDAFRYQAENAALILPLRQVTRPAVLPAAGDPAWETALNHYFQCLNLFEVCSNFRRQTIVKPQVFASWVAWFYDILKDWHFRDIWASELRMNYTKDVRNIFDIGVEIFAEHSDDETRLREFYKAVSHIMNDCPVVAKWQDEMKRTPRWPRVRPPAPFGLWSSVKYQAFAPAQPPPAPSRQPEAEVSLSWNGPDDPSDAAALAGRIIGLGTDYISHGEIQTGLSPDGRTWAPDLADLYADDFADPEGRDLLVARGRDGAAVAFAIVAWEETSRRRFAVLEDMAVDPDVRSGGLGARMVEAIIDRVRARGVEWLFLESGVRNTRAHQFYERHGFKELSHVFGRRLSR